jgi:formylglycine-generating enzyme required for sulfatase activity
VEGSELTRTGALLGTPAFMSPEQSRAEPVDARSDIFSLGGTLYYLLTARLPYEGNQAQVLGKLITDEKPRPAHEVNSYVPRPVSDLVAKAMAPKAKDRFATADQLVAEIGRLIKAPVSAPAAETGDMSSEQTGPQLPPGQAPTLDLVPLETVPSPSLFNRVKRYLPWGAAVLAVCLSAVVVWLVLKGGGSHAGGPDGGSGKEEPKKEPPLKPGMVRVKAGDAFIGNDEAELRAHVLTLDVYKDKPNLIEDFVRLNTKPAKKYPVGAFQIDKYEVTNAEYAKFVAETGRKPPKHWNDLLTPPAGKEDHPVVFVSHVDAMKYAEWAGKKLPTEQQWVRAFRGDKRTMYPWGDTWDRLRANTIEHPTLPHGTSPVTATPDDVSESGVYNLVGNVSELMRERGVHEGVPRIMSHGAHWDCDGRAYGVAAFWFHAKLDGHEVNDATGFRCVVEE